MKTTMMSFGDLRTELSERLSSGDRITLEEVARELEGYSSIKEPRITAYGQIARVRRELSDIGIPVVLVAQGTYGIPKDEAEVAYAMHRYQTIAKNISIHAMILKTYAEKKSILPRVYAESTLKLPSFAYDNK